MLGAHPSQLHLIIFSHLKPKVGGGLAAFADGDASLVGGIALARGTESRHIVTMAAIVWCFVDKPCFLPQYRSQQNSITIHIVFFCFG